MAASIGDPGRARPQAPASTALLGRGLRKAPGQGDSRQLPALLSRSISGVDRLLCVPQWTQEAGKESQRSVVRRGVHVHTLRVAGPPPAPGPGPGPEAAPAAALGRLRGNGTPVSDTIRSETSCAVRFPAPGTYRSMFQKRHRGGLWSHGRCMWTPGQG